MIPAELADSIAIIGMACRFPDAENVNRFWQNLKDGRCSLRTFTDAELAAAGVPEAWKSDPAYVRAGYPLDDPLDFDADFFGMSAGEAERMDPQHRLFLETVWTAFEHAGLDPERFDGEIGVFSGAKMSTYHLGHFITRSLACDATGVQSLISSDKDYTALRAAYAFDLKGPAVTVQSACSTSLVAVHMACESLLNGGCDMAVAGAAALLHPQTLGYRYQEGMVLSADGMCRAFDKEASGMAVGNGVGAVVLKRYEDAVNHGDPVLALIRGSAMNNDGRTKAGFTAPAVEGQRRVIQEALTIADVDPATIGYVEAHGTGTEIGDPIEVTALTDAFAAGPAADKTCAIGSVKTNIGHLDTAAGIAGVMKAALCLHHATLVPSLHFTDPNPEIDFEKTPFFVNTKTQPWMRTRHPRRAGVSSFGIGGTNVHLVMEEAPEKEGIGNNPADTAFPLVLSAPTPSALRQRAADLAAAMEATPAPSLAAISHTLVEGRRHFPHRIALAANRTGEAARRLKAFSDHTDPDAVIHSHSIGGRRILAFTGQGSLTPAAAAHLIRTEQRFRETLEWADALLQDRLPHSVSSLLSDPDLAEHLTDPVIQQPVHFALAWALWAMWQKRGYTPDLIIGHSIGLFPAAACANAIPFEEALLLVAKRGALAKEFAPKGEMIAVLATPEEIRPFLSATKEASVSVYNGDTGIVISGTPEVISPLMDTLSENRFRCTKLPMDRPFHTPAMEPAARRFAEAAAALSWQTPSVPLVQDLSGTLFSAAPDATYWHRHFMEPVRFDLVMENLSSDDLILEIGGRPMLSGMIRTQGIDAVTIPSLRPGVPDNLQVEESAAALFIQDAIPASALFLDTSATRVHLPTYPWERRTYALPTVVTLMETTDPVRSGADRLRASAPGRLSPLDPEGLARLRPEMENRLAAYVTSALSGLVPETQAPLLSDLMEKTPKAFHPLLSRLMATLCRMGQATIREERITFAPLTPSGTDGDLANGLMEHPTFGNSNALFAFLHRCGTLLPDVLSGTMEPREVLFPGGKFDLLDRVYRNHPQADAMNTLMADAVAGILATADPDHRISVTEVGAGTGATTAALLEVLPETRTHYQFTDISPIFLDRALETFGDRITCRIFDLTKSPETQGIPAASQDLVVAANSLHTTADMQQALRHAAALLRPGGVLLLREMTRPGLVFDLTFGPVMPVFAENDPREELPYLTMSGWRELAADCGLLPIAQAPDADETGFDEHVILLQKPGTLAFHTPRTPAVAGPDLHPLLGTVTHSPLGHSEFSTLLDPRRLPFLRDHRIHGVPVLPGTAFMEIPLAAAEKTGMAAAQLQDLAIHRAVIPRTDGTTRLTTVLSPEGDGYRLKIFSKESTHWELHAEADLTPSPSQDSGPHPDLSRLRKEITQVISPKTFYARFKDETGVVFGAGFQGIQELYTENHQGLARISLPAGANAPSGHPNGFLIHPALLDAGLQVIWATRLGVSGTPDTVYLPVALDLCQVLDAPALSATDTLWCHARYETAGEGFIAHLTLYHTDGRPLLALSGLHSYPVSKEALERLAQPQDPAENPAAGLWDLTWHPASLPAPRLTGTWAIVPDAAGRFMAVEAALKAAGAKVYRAGFADEIKDITTGMEGISDLAGLLLLDTPEPPLTDIGAALHLANRTTTLLSAIAGMDRPPEQVVAVTRDAMATADGEGSAIAGAVRTALMLAAETEMPDIRFQVVDLPPFPVADETDQLVTALAGPATTGPRIAVRDNRLLTPVLSATGAAPQDPLAPLDPDGLYVVTGGFGGAGHALIRKLHACGARRIAVCTIHPEAGNTIREALLRETDLILTTYPVDCGDPAAMDTVFTAIEADGIPVKGVFHLAGVLREAGILTETENGITAALSPKLAGAWYLHTRTLGMPLDHFVLFSSISALWGNPGISAYAAANSGLDALSAFRRRMGLPALSVRWGEFSDAGMLAQDTKGRSLRESMGVFSMTTKEGMDRLFALLSSPPVTATIASFATGRLRRAMEQRSDAALFAPAPSMAEEAGSQKDLPPVPPSGTNRTQEDPVVLPPAGETRPAPPTETAASHDLASVTEDLMEKLAARLKVAPSAIAMDADLLTLGMDSLMFVDLADALSRTHSIRLRPHRLLAAATPDAILALLAELLGIATPPEAEDPPKEGETPPLSAHPDAAHDPFPLTDIQQAYWVGRSGAFRLGNIACHSYFEMDCATLDTNSYETAWNALIARHPMLRAVIRSDGRQEVMAEVPHFAIPVQDLRIVTEKDRDLALTALREEMGGQILDTATWPLFDVRISLLPEGKARIHIDIDMLVADIHSIGLMIEELGRLYEDPLVLGTPPTLTFRDFVLDQEMREEEMTAARDYWMNRMDTLPPAPELPIAVSPESLPKPVCVRRTAGMPEAAWAALKANASRRGLTPSALLLSAFAVTIGRWSKSSHFTMNTTLINRPAIHPEIHQVVGDFTSAILLAVEPAENATFTQTAKAIQDRLWEDMEHRAFSGIQVQRERSRRAEGLTDAATGVVFTSALGLASLTTNPITREEMGFGVSQTPQVLFDHQVFEMDGALTFNWDTVDDVFPHGMLDAMFAAYNKLLADLAEDATWDAVHPIPLPEDQALRRLEVNATRTPIPEGRIHDGVIRHARTTPASPAVIHEGGVLTYGALHGGALAVAGMLTPHGIRPDVPVGVMLTKGALLPVALVGVLYAGAPYLPLDPATPPARLAAILEDSGATIVLTDQKMPLPSGVVALDPSAAEEQQALSAPSSVTRPEDLAYILFTSGSTGRPKGVAMEHRSTMNTIRDLIRRCQLNGEDRSLCLSSHTFDLSVFDLFGIWETGGAVIIPSPAADRDPAAWCEIIGEHTVTLWNTVPTLMEMLTDHLTADLTPPVASKLPLRQVFLSGDRILPDLPEKIRTIAPAAQIMALGGATEAAIWSIHYPITTVDPGWKNVPYGTPLSNQQFHVLDAALQPAPDWVTGGLFISGTGLAREYWRDPERTETAFFVHPETGVRLYRTGDLGRYRDDGIIEISGREDAQVKVNGYRIELGEVEAAFRRHKGVKDAVAQAVGTSGQDRRLVGYVVPETGSKDLFIEDATDTKAADRTFTTALAAGFDAAKSIRPLSDGFRDAWFRLETLHDQSLRNLMATLGFFTTVGERHTVSAIMRRARFKDRYEKWIRRGLACLEKDGWLIREEDATFRSVKAMAPVDVEPEIQRILDDLHRLDGLVEPPQMGLMFTVARELCAVLREDIHSAELYASEEAKSVYRKLFRDCNRILISTIDAIAASFPPDRPLRVLEVGAGHGGTTGVILDCFDPENTEYVYTDISDYFLENAATTFARYPFVSYRQFDLDLPPDAQGLARRQYDLVVASSVLHDTRDLHATLRNLEAVTAPGGMILITEETKFFRSFDLQMGVQQGFDVFHDTGFRADHPLADRTMWSDALVRAGYTDPTIVTESGSTIDFLGFDIIAARMPAAVRRFDEAGLSGFLEDHLPPYMIPGRILVLDALPVSANGKIDRKRLPIPDREIADRKAGYTPPETETQTLVAQVWESLLKLDRIGIHDNVFAAGGDSLMATRATTRLQQQFGVALTVQHIYAAPTVALLAAAIDTLQTEASSPVVCLRPGTGGTPIFCLHEAADSLNGYRHFPELIPPQIPLYGLVPPEGETVTTISETATRYIEAIRKVQPDGPFHLAGFCMGGILAQEMARQLEQEEETVRLALLDPVPFPEGFETDALNLLASALTYHRIPLALFGLAERFTEEERQQGMDTDLADTEDAAITQEELSAMPQDARIAFIHSVAREKGYLPEEVEYPAFRHACTAIAAGIRAIMEHTPKPCGVPTLFFRARLPENRPDPVPYWEEHHGEFPVMDVDGDHFAMMERPNVDPLVHQLIRHFRTLTLVAA